MMLGENGLTIITVNKNELLSALVKNRDKHVQDYNDAMEGYKEESEKEVLKLLDRVRNGDFSEMHVKLTKPVSHEKDYTKVINMLTMSIDTEIKISDEQFMMYVEDDWRWREQFEAVKNNYGKRIR